MRDINTKVYDTRNIVFSDQNSKFPKKYHSSNKYIMVMVDIDSNTILVKTLKKRKDTELTREYCTMMLHLKRAGIVPKNHILDNEVSDSMKSVFRDEYQTEMDIVRPGCHRLNAVNVAIRNFKAYFLSV